MINKKHKKGMMKDAIGTAGGLIGFGAVGGLGGSIVTSTGGDATAVTRLTSYAPTIANISGAGIAMKGVSRLGKKRHKY